MPLVMSQRTDYKKRVWGKVNKLGMDFLIAGGPHCRDKDMNYYSKLSAGEFLF